MPSHQWPQPAILATMPNHYANESLSNEVNSETITNNTSSTSSQSSSSYRVLALYKFVSPKIQSTELRDLQSEIETTCRKHMARGTLLLAEEGINGTICYPFEDNNENIADGPIKDILLDYLQSKFDYSLRTRISQADRPIFARLKIKIKSEIVTMHWKSNNLENNIGSDVAKDDTVKDEIGASSSTDGTACACDCSPIEQVGEYVKPKDWNQLLLDPDTLVVDTRNEYEINVGTFQNAINPHTQSFVEFPDWMKSNIVSNEDKPKKIAMFCTGGIRCEKATSACLQLVSEDVSVFHLEGGILAYLNDIPPEESMFQGDCYVFDQRVALTYGLKPSTKYQTSCHACRRPLSVEDTQRDDYIKGLSCHHCAGKITEKQKERFAQRQSQIELALKEGRVHIHDPKEEQLRRD